MKFLGRGISEQVSPIGAHRLEISLAPGFSRVVQWDLELNRFSGFMALENR